VSDRSGTTGVASVAAPLQADVALGPLTTYRVGGAARRFARLESAADLEALLGLPPDRRRPVLVVGQGSNLLVADSGFDGLAVTLGEAFAGVEVEGERVVLGGAARLPVVARRLAHRGVTGFEWAVGVPGSVGGAVRMNAGGHGADLAASLVSADLVDLGSGRRWRAPAHELALGYRSSALEEAHLVLAVELRLGAGDPAASLALVDEIVAWRRANQPGGANAGSVFSNPPGASAGQLIDEAGGRGLRVGSASVSTKHANFIQADAGGRADDVWALMHVVRARVAAAGGPDLRPETVLVGFPHAFGSAAAEVEAERIAAEAGAGRR
jgi:UDP-N-acetylmuramate dehydrogenase